MSTLTREKPSAASYEVDSTLRDLQQTRLAARSRYERVRVEVSQARSRLTMLESLRNQDREPAALIAYRAELANARTRVEVLEQELVTAAETVQSTDVPGVDQRIRGELARARAAFIARYAAAAQRLLDQAAELADAAREIDVIRQQSKDARLQIDGHEGFGLPPVPHHLWHAVCGFDGVPNFRIWADELRKDGTLPLTPR